MWDETESKVSKGKGVQKESKTSSKNNHAVPKLRQLVKMDITPKMKMPIKIKMKKIILLGKVTPHKGCRVIQ